MPFAVTNFTELKYAREATFQTAPVDAKRARFTGHSISKKSNFVNSQDIYSDRQIRFNLRTGSTVDGDLNYEFSVDTYDDFLVGLMRNEWRPDFQTSFNDLTLNATDQTVSSTTGCSIVVDPLAPVTGGKFGVVAAANPSAGNYMFVAAATADAAATDGKIFTFDYDRVTHTHTERAGSLLTVAGADEFGTAVALSNDGLVMVVGEMWTNDPASLRRGRIHRYGWNAGTGVWDLIATFVPAGADSEDEDWFGSALSLNEDGSILTVGSPGWDGAVIPPASFDLTTLGNLPPTALPTAVTFSSVSSKAGVGAVFVYSWDAVGTTWTPVSRIYGGDISLPYQSGFGYAVSMITVDATTVRVMVGAPYINMAYRLTIDTSTGSWTLDDQPLQGDVGSMYGSSVYLSDDSLMCMVGAPDNGTGRIHLYDYQSRLWLERIDNMSYATTDVIRYGSHLAITHDKEFIAVGADSYTDSVATQGAVLICPFDVFRMNFRAGDWVKFIAPSFDAYHFRVERVSQGVMHYSHPDYNMTDVSVGNDTYIKFYRMPVLIGGGREPISFSIEDERKDVNRAFFRFNGMYVSQATMAVATGSLVTGTFSMQGVFGSHSDETMFTGTITEETLTSPHNAVEGAYLIYNNGSIQPAHYKSINLTVNNNLRNQDVVTKEFPVDQGLGHLDATLTASMYFKDRLMYETFVNNRYCSMAFILEGRDPGNKLVHYIFDFPHAKITSATATPGQWDNDQMVELQLTTLRHPELKYSMKIAKYISANFT